MDWGEGEADSEDDNGGVNETSASNCKLETALEEERPNSSGRGSGDVLFTFTIALSSSTVKDALLGKSKRKCFGVTEPLSEIAFSEP